MKNISIKGILIGLVSLIIIDSLGEMLLVLLLGGELSGDSMRELSATNSFLLLRFSIFGIIPVALGGYITARIAKSSIYLNTAIIGGICLMLTVFGLGDSYPKWYLITQYIVQFPAALLGGFIMSKGTKFKNLASHYKTIT
jgi:hypothetical protein